MPISKNSNKYSDGDGSYQKYYTAALIELDWASGQTTQNVQKISKNAENKKKLQKI